MMLPRSCELSAFSYQLPHAPAALSMAPLTAAGLLALSRWLLALPAGLRALEKGDFLEALLKTEDRGSSQWRANAGFRVEQGMLVVMAGRKGAIGER